MKAKDLMLGDWFKTTYPNNRVEYRKVTSIYENGYVGCHACVTNAIEPIPITPEILEKNGFEQYGKDAYCLSIPIQMAGDGFERQDVTIHRMKVLELRTSTCTLLMPIKFVHQLQHALRLCGIEKEIEL